MVISCSLICRQLKFIIGHWWQKLPILLVSEMSWDFEEFLIRHLSTVTVLSVNVLKWTYRHKLEMMSDASKNAEKHVTSNDTQTILSFNWPK